jgi:acetylornithine deacetylase/succinyl-diaminopimelate desuccinylase-like protein
MSETTPQSGRERSILYIVVTVIVVALAVVALVMFRAGRENAAAEQKATQLTQALEARGLSAPSTDQIVRVLGDDGGAVCTDPNGAITRALALGELASGAELPEVHRRPQDGEWVMITDVHVRTHAAMRTVRAELAELVALRSVADPRQFPEEGCRQAADLVRDKFLAEGFTDARLEMTADGSHAVVGSRSCTNPDAPTVLLYAHYDVQPPLDEAAWRTPPFENREIGGRWYGRGAADCKGNILMHLVALRALGDDVPVNLKLVVEGSEEAGTGGLEAFVASNPDLFRADAILVCDTGNAAVGRPAVTVSLRGMVNVVISVEALESEVHSGMFGGPAPDALAALIAILATLRDADGNTVINGLDHSESWIGEPYPAEQFRGDAGLLDGVRLIGDGTVSDMLWARPALTVLGIDCPAVLGSTAALVPRTAARLNLRIPPGVDSTAARDALVAHLLAAAPWGVHVSVDTEAIGSPFRAETTGPAYRAMAGAMAEAFGVPMTTLGQGGSIPLCNVFADTYPDAEIILMGVEEPVALIHAPNESVDPDEIEHCALAEALFLENYAEELGSQRSGDSVRESR